MWTRKAFMRVADAIPLSLSVLPSRFVGPLGPKQCLCKIPKYPSYSLGLEAPSLPANLHLVASSICNVSLPNNLYYTSTTGLVTLNRQRTRSCQCARHPSCASRSILRLESFLCR
jgi:hypothetical protein